MAIGKLLKRNCLPPASVPVFQKILMRRQRDGPRGYWLVRPPQQLFRSFSVAGASCFKQGEDLFRRAARFQAGARERVLCGRLPWLQLTRTT